MLIASGGHTQILAVKGVGDYDRLGATMDDAIGEAFDKTAKLLGLPFPGGPAVEAAAKAAIQLDLRCLAHCSGGQTPIFRCLGSRQRCGLRRNPSRHCGRAT